MAVRPSIVLKMAAHWLIKTSKKSAFYSLIKCMCIYMYVCTFTDKNIKKSAFHSLIKCMYVYMYVCTFALKNIKKIRFKKTIEKHSCLKLSVIMK